MHTTTRYIHYINECILSSLSLFYSEYYLDCIIIVITILIIFIASTALFHILYCMHAFSIDGAIAFIASGQLD